MNSSHGNADSRGSGRSQYQRGRHDPEEVKYDSTGREINPYIPKYITNAPWYAEKDDSGDYLGHQRTTEQKEQVSVTEIDARKRAAVGKMTAPLPQIPRRKKIRFQKGSCTNCGSLKHTAKDCLERPRQISSKHTGVDIKVLEDDLRQHEFDRGESWDEKRDQWSTFDIAEYDELVKKKAEAQAEAEAAEAQRRVEQELLDAENLEAEVDITADLPELDEFDDYADLSDEEAAANILARANRAAKLRAPQNDQGLRTLRERDDVAVYLQNLQAPGGAGGEVSGNAEATGGSDGSAEPSLYNPKSRTLRQNDERGFVNDKEMYVRKLTGEAEEFERLKRLASEVNEGKAGTASEQPIHLEGAPTAGVVALRELEAEKSRKKAELEAQLAGKYGSDAFLKPKPESLKITELEAPKAAPPERGMEGKNPQKSVPKSRYAEDVFPGNHTSVWGSYWQDGQWGYACCHQTVKNAYCYGVAGMQAAEEVKRQTEMLGK